MPPECVTLFSPVMPWQPWLINDKRYCVITPWATGRYDIPNFAIFIWLMHLPQTHIWPEMNHTTSACPTARICLWICHILCSKDSLVSWQVTCKKTTQAFFYHLCMYLLLSHNGGLQFLFGISLDYYFPGKSPRRQCLVYYGQYF